MPVRPAVLKKSAEDGMTYLRGSVLVAFFLEKPFHEAVGGVLSVFDDYLAMIPPDALKWSSIGAASEEWKPVAKTTFDRCRTQMTPAAVKKRDLSSFELADGDKGGDAPGYSFMAVGGPVDPEVPDEKDLVQMSFPSSVVDDEAEADAFAGRIRSMAAKLPYVSGYASPALLFAELHKSEALTEAKAFAMRYPGFDVQINELGRMDLDERVRGARWLTFLGPSIVKQLKGSKAVREALPKTATVEPTGAGLMVRAGAVPEMGDTNRKVATPLLRAVARLLEPVTLFEETVLQASNFAFEDPEFLRTWERRFLD
ncbi:MAG: DUF3396 domain-containing protein [Planctomycetes bacterium]|nr:DUF3396 domain-containing protein [Planctomycetota bacterium]